MASSSAERNQRMRTPLAHAYGLGPAKHGVSHWWAIRLTSIALIPLGIWFVVGVIDHAGTGYGPFRAWLARPFVAIAMLLFIGSTFWHTALGLQVVIEDYFHHRGAKLAVIVGLKFLAVALAVASIFAVLRVAFGA